MNEAPPTPGHVAGTSQGIVAEKLGAWTILKPASGKPHRRILYLNSYGMANAWPSVRDGHYPGAHLWGCMELVRKGYEVAMPEEPNRDSRFFNYRRQDLKHLLFAKSWLRRDGIVYSAHTILFWVPLLFRLRLLYCPIVTCLYARGENLRVAESYRGVLALTPAAEIRARELAPSAEIAHVSWGVDLPFYPPLPYEPNWFLSCGKTRRDFVTLAAAAAKQTAPLHVIQSEPPSGISWPVNVKLITGGRGDDWMSVSYQELIQDHYAGCIAALIILQEDSAQRYGAGFTQLLEAMALGRPVIVTRTGALAEELDVEKQGCGLFVPPNDIAALSEAMQTLIDDPARAEAMGQAGRRLCESYYNMGRFGNALHEFFERL